MVVVIFIDFFFLFLVYQTICSHVDQLFEVILRQYVNESPFYVDLVLIDITSHIKHHERRLIFFWARLHSNQRLKDKDPNLGLDSIVDFGSLVLERVVNFESFLFREISFVFGQVIIQIFRVFRTDVPDGFINEGSEISGGNKVG